MTDFQVGDRVSVEGVVTNLWPDSKEGPMSMVRLLGEKADTASELWVEDCALTLIERPRRKLRVGSVWECVNGQRYVAVTNDWFAGADARIHRAQLSFDEEPESWREVPVEELEREAGA